MKKQLYIVSVEDLAYIMKYCARETIAGSHTQKDWTENIKRAIGLCKAEVHGMPKLKLPKHNIDKSITKG